MNYFQVALLPPISVDWCGGTRVETRFLESWSVLLNAYLVELAIAQSELRCPATPSSDLDWSSLWKLARHHGLLLVLGRYHLAEAPESFRQKLQSYCLLSRIHQDRMRSELARIQAALQEVQCANLLLKGFGLADLLYGELSHLRPTSDLDLLVSPEQLDLAHRTLLGLGYQCCHNLGAMQWRRWAAVRNQMPYLGPSGIGVELHWSPRSLGSGLNQAAPGWLAKGEISAVDLLLYLADHGACHWWQRLQWVADFARLLNSQCWNADELLMTARRYGLVQRLELGCALVNWLFGVPSPIAYSLKSRLLADWLARSMLSTDWPTRRNRHLTELLSYDGPLEALRGAFMRSLRPSDRQLLGPALPRARFEEWLLRRLGNA